MLALGAVLRQSAQEIAVFRAREAPRHGTQRSAEEVLEQFVLQRNDGLERTRIALAGASAEQLPIDARGIVEFGQNDVQPAGFHDLGPKLRCPNAAGAAGATRATSQRRLRRAKFRAVIFAYAACCASRSISRCTSWR